MIGNDYAMLQTDVCLVQFSRDYCRVVQQLLKLLQTNWDDRLARF